MSERLNLPQIADTFGISLVLAGRALQSVERYRGLALRSDIQAWLIERERERADRRARSTGRATTVYLVYGEAGGDPIYIGITATRTQRLGSHRRAEIWWQEAAEIHLEHYASRDRAERRELELIRLFSPKYNKAGKLPEAPTVLPG